MKGLILETKFGDYANDRSSRPEVFCKKGVLRNFAKFTGKHLCQSLFFNKVADLRPATLLKKDSGNFIKKKTLTQVFPCEFCDISKNTFSYRTPPVAASAMTNQNLRIELFALLALRIN